MKDAWMIREKEEERKKKCLATLKYCKYNKIKRNKTGF